MISAAPSRVLQLCCAVAAALGFLPWASMFGDTVFHAIESPSPVAMSLAAWLVLLVPLWVVWFAILAWQKRDVSVRPAVLMALPAVVITALVLALPSMTPAN
jgi:hypothetical protein